MDWKVDEAGMAAVILKSKLTQEALRPYLSSHRIQFLETHEFNLGWERLINANRVAQRLWGDTATSGQAIEEEEGDANDEKTWMDTLHAGSEGEQPFLSDEERRAKFIRENPVLGLLTMMPMNSINPAHPLMGYVQEADTAAFMSMLRHPAVKTSMGTDVGYLLAAKPTTVFKPGSGNYYDLVAIKPMGKYARSIDFAKPVSAEVRYDGDYPYVHMTFGPEDANHWAAMTEANVGHCIAIVQDGSLLSYPNVQGRIKGGSSQITGGFSPEDAEAIVTALLSGKTPVKMTLTHLEAKEN